MIRRRRRDLRRRRAARERDSAARFDSQLLAAIVRSSEDAIISTTLSGEVTSWNAAAERIYGYSAEQRIGKSIDVWLPAHRKDEDVAILAELFTRDERIARIETERIASDGSLVPVSLTISPIRDEDAGLVGLSLISRDVIERKILEAEVEYLHRHDKLTGLYGRREFEHELRRQLPYSRRYGPGGAVVLLDVDDLRSVNTGLGRKAGDQLLVHLARLLTDRLRTTDTVARLTGDQFAVLLPEVEEQSARKVADDLLERIASHPARLGGRSRRVTCSIGISRFDNGAVYTVEGLLAAAERAVEEAKRRGGSCVAAGGSVRDASLTLGS